MLLLFRGDQRGRELIIVGIATAVLRVYLSLQDLWESRTARETAGSGVGGNASSAEACQKPVTQGR